MKTLAAVMLFATAVQAASIVGPEHAAAPPAYTTTVTAAQAAATDGTRFLVFSSFYPPLRASIVSPDGKVSTPSRVISRATTRGVAVVWTGDSYLATWSEGSAIVAARLSADGTLLAPSSIVLAGLAAEHGQMAWNGRNALLLYITPEGTLGLALLDIDGHVLKSGIPLPSGKFISAGVLTAVGDTFVYCWGNSGSTQVAQVTPPPPSVPDVQVLALRISATGDVSPASPILITRLAAWVSALNIATDGQRCAISFASGPFNAAVVQRFILAADSTVQQLPPVAVASASAAPVAWNGREFVSYWITWAMVPPVISSSSDLYALAFRPDAVPAAVVHMPRYAIDPMIVSSGPATLALWTDFRFTVPYATQFSAAFAAVLDPASHSVIAGSADGFPISMAATPESAPALATSGGAVLLAWVEQTPPTAGLSAVLVDKQGLPVTTEPLVVTTAVNGTSAVLAIRDFYLVLWSGTDASGSAIYGRRITADGTFIDSEPVKYASGGAFAAVSTGSSGLIAIIASDFKTISAVRIDSAGLPVGVPVVVVQHFGSDLSIAWNGSEYLVTWTEGSDFWQFPTPNLLDVYGARVDANGTPLDVAPIAIATGPTDQHTARVASDGRDFLVVYATEDWMTQATFVSAKRVLSEGALADTTADAAGTVLPITPPLGYTFSLCRNGAGYALAWEGSLPDYSSVANLIFLDSRAKVLDRVEAVASSPDGNLQPVVVVTAFGATMAYSRLATEPEYSDAHRVFVRRIMPVVSTRQRAAGR